jgi:hypothetical protein
MLDVGDKIKALLKERERVKERKLQILSYANKN